MDREALAKALSEAQEAHHGQPPEGWAAWYAGWLINHHPELFRGDGMQHFHACCHCGQVWAHEANDAATRAEFIAAHTCDAGHVCTVKLDKLVAYGIQGLVNDGCDPLPYLKTVDPEAHFLLTRSNR